MPLAVLVLAEVLVVIRVVAEAESLHEPVLEHSLVDEAIVVEQCTNAVHLVVAIDLAVVETILDLQADEVVLQIGPVRGL